MDVIKAVQLLMNARARLEAMIRMDRHDRAGAQQILRSVMAPTHALVSEAVSPSVRAELERELKELDMQADRIERADDDILSRKQMAYARYSRRTGK